jgi:prepilin-type N-terminal cleavage/methylation domain-containing protein
MKNEKKKSSKGFTIVELLTVMGVIAILISLLVPALAAVRDMAMELKQKAQFHAIEVGLDMYKKSALDYPPSNDNSMTPLHLVDSTPYSGANKLAEALAGQDFLGFHPNSDYRADGTFSHPDGSGGWVVDAPVYHLGADYVPANNAFVESIGDNIKARSYRLGIPFVDVGSANAFTMDMVYGTGPGGFETVPYSMLLCDVYTDKRVSNAKTGTPILYYRARPQFVEQNWESPITGITDDIYNFEDNENILALGSVGDAGIDHHWFVAGTPDYAGFERMILDTDLTTSMNRPYRADSYILVSAGKDGLFGSADDIFNFETEE